MIQQNIKFECSWGQTSTELARRYNIMSPGSAPGWKDILVDSNKPVDLTVALQKPYLHNDNCLHFRREPDIIESWPPDKCGKNYFDYSSTSRYHVTTWWLTKTYDELTNLKYNTKKYDVSAISSLKHKHRCDFINGLFMEDNNIDVYGDINGRHVPIELRDNVFLKYSKSICIENCSYSNYFTEKIVDSILAWCLPIYWGCPNINEFLPDGSYRVVDLYDIKTAIDIINEPVSDTEIKAMSEARDLILNKYNIWPTIHNFLNNE